ncbi:hypothetical protein [Ferruginibacter profundus]
MTTTKIITNTIYFAGLLAAVIVDLKNFQFYYAIIFIAIQIILIITEYILYNRTIPNEAVLIKQPSAFTLKDLLIVIPLMIVVFAGFNLLFKWFNTKYLVMIIFINMLSMIIQYVIVNGKTRATLLIDKNKLVVNDLFLKSYNLENLKSISFDGFNEVYTAVFAKSKKIKIKQEDFVQDDLNKFIAVMATKSNCGVVLSDNIRNEITAANIPASGVGN